VNLTEGVVKGLREECLALIRVEAAARKMVEFCYTQPVSGSPGWRGTANMYKGIEKPASELRDSLEALRQIRETL
jgi:hypothetical protein